ncbi:MAG: hypothetical protein H8E66_23575 [Planctomycetes bacterium]|nr:hypothetical protein [Planctomycetota bacterium]
MQQLTRARRTTLAIGSDSEACLEAYLRALPPEFPDTVEVRHREFFDEAQHEAALDDLLTELHVDRVTFDGRALFSAPPRRFSGNDNFSIRRAELSIRAD